MNTLPANQINLLVVGSDRHVGGTLNAIAGQMPIRVNTVGDVREAIDCLNGSAYSFLFIDLDKSELEALACIKTLRLNAVRFGRHTPIIALVSNLDAETKARLRSWGVSEIIAKPLTLNSVKAVLFS